MNREMLPINGALELTERWKRLRANYAEMQRLVDAGLDDWMSSDPYQIADWLSIFSPIESSAWQDLRYAGLPMWPQLPVGRFFLDFANPVAKVALECDGMAWHDPKKDAARDTWLEQRGWVVFRAPGWRCNRVMDRPDNWGELDKDEQEKWLARSMDETLRGIIDQLSAYFRESPA